MIKGEESVNKAFSKQSVHYDEDDYQNPILQAWRQQVYAHVNQYLKPGNNILELNAGTGLDALHFASAGYQVHATDLSDGMIREIEKKIKTHPLDGKLTCQQLSYDALYRISDQKFNYVFSNFGGLNCIDDLSNVTAHLPAILKNGAYITWVIMPPVCLWELAGIIKIKKEAFRRLKKNGTLAHLEGEYFQTYYHSLSDIKKAFGAPFQFIKSEGLGTVSPPPHRIDFPLNHPSLYSTLTKADKAIRHTFPFNRLGDHIIVTFQFNP